MPKPLSELLKKVSPDVKASAFKKAGELLAELAKSEEKKCKYKGF